MNHNPKIYAFVQARMGSSRFPGKILEMINHLPMYYWVVSRLEQVLLIDKVVVLTSDQDQESALIDDCKRRKVEYFQGDEKDVLSRYYEAALHYQKPDVILRITSDCPLIDIRLISEMIELFSSSRADYMSNFVHRRYPRGLDCEIMTFNALERAYKQASKAYQREHVTPYIYENPHEFRVKSFENVKDESQYRLTVDTRDDLELIRSLVKLASHHNDLFDYKKILQILKEHPYLIEINQHIKQKPVQY